jgi:hypothetical protein
LKVCFVEAELGLIGEGRKSMESACDGLFAAVTFASEKRSAEVRSDVTHLPVQTGHGGAWAGEGDFTIPEYAAALPY